MNVDGLINHLVMLRLCALDFANAQRIGVQTNGVARLRQIAQERAARVTLRNVRAKRFALLGE